jgi:large subunit ribosomal protein L10
MVQTTTQSRQRRVKEIRPEKLEAVKEIKEKFNKAKIAIVTDYQGEKGLPVKELQKLRKKLREGNSELKVVRNTLAQKALKELKKESLSNFLEKASALAFGYDDPVSTAKVLFDFAKEHKPDDKSPGLPLIKAGLMENVLLDPNQIKTLASLPPKPVLLAQVMGTMNAPITGLVQVLSGTLRKLLYGLEAIRKQKEA